MNPTDLLAEAIEHHRAGNLLVATQIYQQILESQPDHADALHLLGVIAHQTGDPETSIRLISRAVQLVDDAAGAHANLGIAFQDLRRTDQAIACFRRALELNPRDVESHVNLGVALKQLGMRKEAIISFQTALQLCPDSVPALNNLGIELKDEGKLEESIEAFRRAIELAPNHHELHNNLGNALKDFGELDKAASSLLRAIEIKPDHADAHNNLGNVFKDQGLLGAAIDCYRKSVELSPSFRVAHSNLIYACQFQQESHDPDSWNEYQRWNEHHAQPFADSIKPHRNDRSPDRRLRVGYVSPDFRDHCQAFFTVPLFGSHDRRQFEVVCYADVARPDDLTERLRTSVDLWRDIHMLDDDRVANLIREDRIDILLDLTMHMANNRLPVFARKPAPIQACWLAYPGTTGLPTMGYRITDPYLDPVGLNDGHYSEESIRLPDTFWCYDPLDHETVVAPLPALRNGIVTFGCLNNFCKVKEPILKLWARVLSTVKNSRLAILANPGSHRRRLQDALASEGIDGERVTFFPFAPRPEYLKYYDEIDIGLDTLPYNGHTTSLDSYWMGVPVVTLVGKTVVGRAGVSQLTNLGLPGLIAENPEQYVSIAVELATNLPRLTELRGSLRSRMINSPLMDAARFTRHIEAAYRQMWLQWCSMNFLDDV